MIGGIERGEDCAVKWKVGYLSHSSTVKLDVHMPEGTVIVPCNSSPDSAQSRRTCKPLNRGSGLPSRVPSGGTGFFDTWGVPRMCGVAAPVRSSSSASTTSTAPRTKAFSPDTLSGANRRMTGRTSSQTSAFAGNSSHPHALILFPHSARSAVPSPPHPSSSPSNEIPYNRELMILWRPSSSPPLYPHRNWTTPD